MTICRNLLVAATAAASLTACIPQDSTPESIQRAIPTADQVQIKLPAGSNREIGQLAEFYVATRGITTVFNGGTAWVLILIHAVVQQPPTSVDGDTYTWGPFGQGLDPAEYQLTVRDVGDGTFEWQLSGRPRNDAAADFEVIIDGVADPRAGELQGNGHFLIDFDAGKRVNPIDSDPDARGTVDVHYDLAARHLDLDITTTDDAGQPVIASYAYNEGADRSGDMVFGIDGEMGGGAATEHAEVRSRWLATGEGRADVGLTGGDTGGFVAASECWDASFKRVFFGVLAGDPNGAFGAAEGAEASCVFSHAELPGQ